MLRTFLLTAFFLPMSLFWALLLTLSGTSLAYSVPFGLTIAGLCIAVSSLGTR